MRLEQPKSFGALCCPERGSAGTEFGPTEGRTTKRLAIVLSVTRLKHVEDGVVHLDQHSQVDRQAGLAVLRGGRARQPGEGVVLLQYKPEFEKSCFIFSQVFIIVSKLTSLLINSQESALINQNTLIYYNLILQFKLFF